MWSLVPPLALLIERRFGYPADLQARIGHPVMWFGALIDHLETRRNRPERSPAGRREAGIVGVAVLVGLAAILAALVHGVLRPIPFGWLIEAVLATPFLAQKELGRAVEAVARGLGQSLGAGREAVSHIVGRDPDQLDEAGVARAAIETLAENTSDAVVAPLFWLALLGLPGIVVYKAINTADSMIGHMDERYRDYGWAAAKLDDLVNWIPARLTAVLFTAACFLVPGASPSSAWQAALRDAGKHASPNAGWPEAAMAGALGFSLGGPRAYDGEVVDLPRMGDGRAELGGADIARALGLYRAALNVLLGIAAVLGLMLLAG